MTAPQESGSDFADVVNIEAVLVESPKLSDDNVLSLLHTKFWGKTMAIEEKERRSSLSPTPTIDGDGPLEEDGNESLYQGLDDDTTPGCHVLDLDGFFAKFWICAEYIQVYDYLEEYYNEPSLIRRPPAAIVTGQPGVGTSTWMFYALRRRLAEKKPVMLYCNKRCYLFVNEGVYWMTPDFGWRNFKTIVWTLVDSDEAKDGVPSNLVALGTRLYVIYTTSPRQERWSRLHKTVRVITVVMNPWTRKEILQAGLLLRPESFDSTQINRIFNLCGPTPRLCFELSSDLEKLEDYERTVDKAILNIKADRLEKLIYSAVSFTMDAVFHKIFLIVCQSPDVGSQPIAAPITPFIQSKLANRFRRLGQVERICLHKCLLTAPCSRAMAGIVFEAAALPDKANLSHFPLVQLSKSRKRTLKRLSKWCSILSSISCCAVSTFSKSQS